MSLLEAIGIKQPTEKKEINRAGGTDNEMWSAAQSIGSVGTATPITHYEERTASQNDELEGALKERKEMSKQWGRFLSLNLKWQDQDIRDTQEWAQWAMQTTQNLATKATIVVTTLANQQQILQKMSASAHSKIAIGSARTERSIAQGQERLQQQLQKILSGGADDDD